MTRLSRFFLISVLSFLIPVYACCPGYTTVQPSNNNEGSFTATIAQDTTISETDTGSVFIPAGTRITSTQVIDGQITIGIDVFPVGLANQIGSRYVFGGVVISPADATCDQAVTISFPTAPSYGSYTGTSQVAVFRLVNPIKVEPEWEYVGTATVNGNDLSIDVTRFGYCYAGPIEHAQGGGGSL